MSSVASTTAQVSVLSTTTSTTTTAATTTPLLVTPDSNKSFNDHKNDDSIDDRQLNKQNTNNKTYTRVRKTMIFALSLCVCVSE